MSFIWPVMLWLLGIVPLALLGLLGLARRRERTARAFADPHLLPSLVSRPSARHARLLTGLHLIALALLLLAAARPVAEPPLPTNKAAVVIAIDASRSMLAEDVSPSRLELARAVAEDFVRLAPASTQIGLVSFSDIASVLVPPTTDRELLLEALARVEPARNTSLADAVVAGVRMLPGREGAAPPEELVPPGLAPAEADSDAPAPADSPPPASMIILSDGVSNVSANPALPSSVSLELAGRFAADHAVKLYALPVGRQGGTVARIDGQDYFIPYEPRSLERLAERSDGETLDVSDPEGLREVFADLGRMIRWEARPFEISSLLSGLAIVLLLVAAGIGLRWQRRVP